MPGVDPDQTLVLTSSGVARYTVTAEQQIRGDIEIIGTVSTLGILLLFLLMFRSPRMLLLGLVPLAVGSAVGTVATYLVFGRVHGLTLAFGSSLLGVGIDYAEHYFAHYALVARPSKDGSEGAHTPGSPEHTMADVWPGLRMGAWTTVVGFAGLAWADFPGAQQMALFASAAVFGALLATRYLLPAWMPRVYQRPALMHAAERFATRLVRSVVPRGTDAPAQGGSRSLARLELWLPIAAFAVLALGLTRVKTQDDLRALLALDPALVAEDTAIQGRLQATDPGRFAVVASKKPRLGPSERRAETSGHGAADTEEALDLLAEAHAQLGQAVLAGDLEGFVPLGAVLRSEHAQEVSRTKAVDALPAFDRAAQEVGFQPSAFAPFRRSLETKTAPMTLKALEHSPLAPWLSPLMPRGEDGKQIFVIPLKGVRSTAALQRKVPSAVILDEGELLNQAYGHVRIRVMQLLAAGILFVLATLYLRYRSVRISVAAVAPAVLAAIASVACLGWLHTPVTILHAIGLTLVLSMGVDYGIFAVEGRGTPEESARALVSIATATTTTLLSFGLLAASASPALAALGVTITLGMLFSLLFSPITLFLLGSSTAKSPKESSSP